jgi:predicted acylesterase/phospholipase RssA
MPDTPSLRCDLILKGGITSGVVYPSAVDELSKAYRFVNIGGTSAGAIAAAVTAAAEYARSLGKPAAFDRVAALPKWFGGASPAGTSNLLGLFQPAPELRGLFRTVLAGLNQTGARRVSAIVAASLRQHAPAALLGALPGLVVAGTGWLLLREAGAPLIRILATAGAAVGLLLVAAGAIVASAVEAAWEAVKRLPEHGFGMCPGTGGASSPPPLSDWLDEEIARIAGRTMNEPPLTFGDLASRDVHLTVLTTNVTFGRPDTIPFASHAYAFDPEELRRVLPGRIVDWLVEKARVFPDPELARALREQRLLPLPANEDLPVAFAARLSLSFPLLISAVPLWAFDFSRDFNQQKDGKRPGAKAERCWFLDGGIGSNFPLHFFDAPIPRWPTFAFDLGPFPPDHPRNPVSEKENVWRPRSNGDGLSEEWNRFFDAASPLTKLTGMLFAIVDTMQTWHDNALLKVPGYRDRTVHVFLDPEEGGLNLDMPPAVLMRLEERGRAAGKLLVDAFTAAPSAAGEPPSAWDNHRWVRFRTTMNLLEELHAKFALAYSSGGPPSYEDLLRRLASSHSYGFDPSQQPSLDAAVRAFLTLWQPPRPDPHGFFGGKIPKPIPYLRIVPPTAMPPR